MLAFWFGRILLCLAFIVLSAGVTHACNCGLTSACQAFSDAKAVFSGKLIKVEKELLEKRPLVHAFFAPSEIFKGDHIGKTEKLTFIDGECLKPFESGVEYIVFQDNGPIQNICNWTDRSSDGKGIKDFLARLVDQPRSAWIYAFIRGLSADELRRSEFYFDGKKVTVSELALGNLEFTTSERAKHQIKLILPVTATIDVEDGSVILTTTVRVAKDRDRTIVEYEVDVGTNPCDSRLISVTKL